jgi:polyhydroxyalkanoate synthesis regulator phasin
MKKAKLIAASVIAGAALTVGSVAGAAAHDRGGDRGAGLTKILGGLVTKGTLTQAQVDAINKAMEDLKAAGKAAGKAARDAMRAAHIKVITDTLGITEADLTARMKAGETLATIAGAKKDALIAALVAFHTKQIDEAVTAGKMTADQATKLKANLKDRVTAGVERLKGPGKGFGHHKGMMGGKGHGHGPRA